MARTKQTARKRQPDPQPSPVPVATRPAPQPLNASFKQRKLSKNWSETLNERHPQQNVNLADLLYFKKGDYVNVYSLADEQGAGMPTPSTLTRCARACTMALFAGERGYGHFNLIYIRARRACPSRVRKAAYFVSCQ